ncbi:(2Fe-2S)-binding protein [Solimicrobium silvestre]|uniref:Bacterioferritin-associated ferredoxin n=1 Tax=Solimicrobium silvestre TaxID=2099400 RepID=A0A2S9H0Z7_9BURK|nr:(2Fe-2S)-binding protein [Solimicrobium silvestre]PRC93620.1 BFD-like [2Fe-2S] binding domain [Solimicrobium silvestre]
MIVCVCHNISESRIKTAIQQGINSMPLLRENLELGTCCGKCKSCTKKILRECMPHEDHKHGQHHPIHFHAMAA